MFHSLGAEQENDPSYIVVRDFGTYNDPLSVDRKFRVCTCDTGFSKVDMYSGVRSFKALYVNTALLKFILFGTENQPSSLNIVSDGVLSIRVFYALLEGSHMRFYPLTYSAGRIMHICRFPGIYCSLLPWCKHCGPRSSPVHTMKLLSATQRCRQNFHRVFVRETCFKRFLEFHETVSSNRTCYIL